MKYAKGRHPKKINRNKLAIIIVGIIGALLLVAAAGTQYWYAQQLKPVSSVDRFEVVDIPVGATTPQILKQLEDQNLIRSSQAFSWYLRSKGLRESLQAGRYQINAADSVQNIAAAITQGKIQKNLITIIPGQRLDQIRKTFIKAGFKEADVDAAFDPANYKNHPALVAKPTSASLEGYLYPDSYQLISLTTPKQIVKQSLDEMAEALTPEVIDGFQKQGLGIHQGVTLASIVVKEASNSEDRRQIAGVFFNRLRSNISLGSDPTYQYIADITGQARSPFIDSPYNTRKFVGLPPGPISNMDKNSLTAVAVPLPTNNLFFVAGDNGNVYFSKTQAEHEALIAKYCIKLCSVY